MKKNKRGLKNEIGKNLSKVLIRTRLFFVVLLLMQQEKNRSLCSEPCLALERFCGRLQTGEECYSFLLSYD